MSSSVQPKGVLIRQDSEDVRSEQYDMVAPLPTTAASQLVSQYSQSTPSGGTSHSNYTIGQSNTSGSAVQGAGVAGQQSSIQPSTSSGGLFQSMMSVGAISVKSNAPSSASTSRQASQMSVDSATQQEPPYSLHIEDYQVQKVIGFGSSASVHVAVYKPLNKQVAIKVIELDQFERNQIDELRKELQVMTLSRHPNLLPVKGSFVVESKLYIVTPLCYAGSCLDIMKCAFTDGLDEGAISCILKQALQGLEYLHKTGLIHRDVKSGNLLMEEDGTVRLADFGVSASLYDVGDRGKLRKTFVGTPCWISPEIVQQTGYNQKTDIWSFGITALELAHGRAPFSKFPPMKVLMMTLQNDPPTLDRNNSKRKFTRTFKDMIDSCLIKDPAKRPSSDKLLQHSFFRHAKKKQYLVDMIISKIPPVVDRPHKEPKVVMQEQMEEQSWDFDDVDVAKLTLGKDEIYSDGSNEVSPYASDEALSSGAQSRDRSASSVRGQAQDFVMSPSGGGGGAGAGSEAQTPASTQQQKKGRFVVDVPSQQHSASQQHHHHQSSSVASSARDGDGFGGVLSQASSYPASAKQSISSSVGHASAVGLGLMNAEDNANGDGNRHQLPSQEHHHQQQQQSSAQQQPQQQQQQNATVMHPNSTAPSASEVKKGRFSVIKDTIKDTIKDSLLSSGSGGHNAK
ncbi:hypothetical protein MIR68_003380 [Amoeboaphelidium protococcarum]|nr:hypothetical protein MIR68_003380 [Amoeboaphelidium protococcarum]